MSQQPQWPTPVAMADISHVIMAPGAQQPLSWSLIVINKLLAAGLCPCNADMGPEISLEKQPHYISCWLHLVLAMQRPAQASASMASCHLVTLNINCQCSLIANKLIASPLRWPATADPIWQSHQALSGTSACPALNVTNNACTQSGRLFFDTESPCSTFDKA